MPGFDLKQVNRNDQGIIACGVLAFIFSLLPYYGVTFGGRIVASANAWHSYAFLGMLLILAAAALVAARVFSNATLPTLPLGMNLIVAGLAGLGTLLVIVRAIDAPHVSVAGASLGIRYGGYLLFIAGIAETVFAVLNFRASGEKVAWNSAAMTAPPAYQSPSASPAAQAAGPADEPPSSRDSATPTM